MVARLGVARLSLFKNTFPFEIVIVSLPLLLLLLPMVDTQRFAIWHPPAGMSDAPTAKKPAIISTPQQPPTRFSKNIGQILNQYHWKDDVVQPSTSPPKTSPTNQAPPSWSFKPTAPPPQPQPSQQIKSRFSATVEEVESDSDESSSSSEEEEEEEVIAAAPVWHPPPKLSPPQPAVTPSAPPIIETRPKVQERLQFPKPKVIQQRDRELIKLIPGPGAGQGA